MANYILLTDEAAGLYHHGILGQKWGIRRYQNEDGTWTAEGKKRYSDDYKQSKKDLRAVRKTYRTETRRIQRLANGKWGLGLASTSLSEMAKNTNLEEQQDAANQKYVDQMYKTKLMKYKGDTTKAASSILLKTGLPNSYQDKNLNRLGTSFISKVVEEEGEAAANAALKRARNIAIGSLVGSTAVAVGSYVVSGYMLGQYY